MLLSIYSKLTIIHVHYKYTVNKHLQVIIIFNFFEVTLSFVVFDGIQISSLLYGKSMSLFAAKPLKSVTKPQIQNKQTKQKNKKKIYIYIYNIYIYI